MRLVSVVTSTRSPLFDALADLAEQVVDLAADRAHLDLRVEQAGRADDLLDDHALGLAAARTRRASPRRRSPGGMRSSNSSNLSGRLSSARRQAEAVLDQRLLARAVAAVHRADLRHRLVRLVDEQQEVLGEVVDQRRRRLARRAARQVARVVLDALAEAHLLQHLEVVQRALLEPLLLEQLVLRLAARRAARAARPGCRSIARVSCSARRDVVRAGEDRHLVELAQHLAAQRIDLGDRLDLVAEELDADRRLLLVGREDLDHVAAHAEGAAVRSRRRCARTGSRPAGAARASRRTSTPCARSSFMPR